MPIGFTVILTDLTRQRQEDARLRIFELAFEQSLEPLLITESEPIDEPGPRIVYANRAFTAHEADQALRDAQAQPGAAESMGRRAVGLLEGPEQPPKVFLRYADALFGDRVGQGRLSRGVTGSARKPLPSGEPCT